MILVGDILPAIKRVLGNCSDDVAFERMNEAVDLLKNTGLWDPLVGIMDICTQRLDITLPDDVEVPLAINVGGTPTNFQNKWFEFHLNGPGSECCGGGCTFAWQDKGSFPTFRDFRNFIQIQASSSYAEASDAVLRVFGYDSEQHWIMTPDSTGTLVDGFDVPINGMLASPLLSRITRVMKPVTRGFVSLNAYETANPACTCTCPVTAGAILIGYYRPSDTEPSFRRITLSGDSCSRLQECCWTNSWVRMRFRRKVFIINSPEDLIPLNSSTAVKMAVMAVRKYEMDLPEEYDKYFGLAVQALQRDQKSRSGPNQIKIQMQRGAFMSHLGENMI